MADPADPTAPAPSQSKATAFVVQLWLRVQRWFGPSLWAELERLEAEAKKLRTTSGLLPEGPVRRTVQQLADDAQAASRRNDIEGGWQALNAAKEVSVLAASPEELAVLAVELRKQAQALPPAARRAVLRLLDARPLRHAAVRKALEMRNGHWSHAYQSSTLKAARMSGVGLALAAGLAGFLWVATAPGIPFSPFNDDHARSGAIAVAVVLIGMLAGSVSSVIAQARSRSILPEAAKDAPWHLIRPLVGAAAATLVCLLAASRLVAIEVVSDMTYLGLGVVGGFSEAFLIGAVAKASGKDARKEGPDQDGKGDAGDGGDGGEGDDGAGAPDAPAPPPRPAGKGALPAEVGNGPGSG